MALPPQTLIKRTNNRNLRLWGQKPLTVTQSQRNGNWLSANHWLSCSLILRSLSCVAMSCPPARINACWSQSLRAGPQSGGQGHCGRFLSQHSLGFNQQHRECRKRPNDLHSFIGHWPANTSLTLSWPDLMNEMKSFPFSLFLSRRPSYLLFIDGRVREREKEKGLSVNTTSPTFNKRTGGDTMLMMPHIILIGIISLCLTLSKFLTLRGQLRGVADDSVSILSSQYMCGYGQAVRDVALALQPHIGREERKKRSRTHIRLGL